VDGPVFIDFAVPGPSNAHFFLFFSLSRSAVVIASHSTQFAQLIVTYYSTDVLDIDQLPS
jgi:hypothetical protein